MVIVFTIKTNPLNLIKTEYIKNLCNSEVKDLFNTFDLMITKGQGNYETFLD
jgi:uncharacterized protein with ATP-grasp and redox domains